MAVRMLKAPDLAKPRHRQDIHSHPQLFHNCLTIIPQLVFAFHHALDGQRFPNQQDTDFFLRRNLCG